MKAYLIVCHFKRKFISGGWGQSSMATSAKGARYCKLSHADWVLQKETTHILYVSVIDGKISCFIVTTGWPDRSLL